MTEPVTGHGAATSGPPAGTLSPLEIASGMVFGRYDLADPLPEPVPGRSPRAALEASILEGLLRPPCVVSFSGGRDSSLVLAIAAHVARREGLPLPIPISLRFPEDPDSYEDEWQHLVVEHLTLPEWQRLSFDTEMDVVGPLAAETLRRHGLQWPFNAYFHLPILRAASGGSVLTGAGGDELLSSGLWHRENLVLSGRARPRRSDIPRIAVALGPRRSRHWYLERRFGAARQPQAWLRPEAAARVHRLLLAEAAAEPLSLAAALRRMLWRSRSHVLGLASLAAVATDTGARALSPLSDGHVLAAVIRTQRWRDYRNRAAAVAELAGDLLPEALVTRRTKAAFPASFFTAKARTFVAEWDGSGVDSTLVDADQLRRIWTDDEALPDARSFALLQSAWLRADRKVNPSDQNSA